jgi:dTDP-4-amino-4,6-dideoxygalactose transaminase
VRRLRAEIDEAISRVLDGGWYVGGPEVERFESAFAGWLGVPHAVGVANGTDAIALALKAAGVGAGDEVVIPAASAYPTAVAIVQSGAVPVFADVGADGLLDAARAESAIGARTKAMVPVHLYGFACDLDAIAEICARRRLHLVEDCAQAHGTRFKGEPAGARSVAAAWSFYPTKNLGAVGDAGAVTTADDSVAARLRKMRNYGQTNRYEHDEPGVNSRLDPLQAAILQVKLRHLDEENQRRRQIAATYDTAFARCTRFTPLRPAPETVPSRHLYPVRVARAEDRGPLQDWLSERGIETLIHYPIAMPDQRASSPAWRKAGPYPNAQALCATVLSFPNHPELTSDQVAAVVDAAVDWNRAG